MRKLLAAGVFAAAVAATLSIGTGAVTNAHGGFGLSDTVQDLGNGRQGTISATIDQNLSVANGDISLVATGTTTETLTIGGWGCGNYKMWWDDSPAGSAYRVTKRTSWNVSNNCDVGYTPSPGSTVDKVEFWANDGHYSNMGSLAQNATAQSLYISTGTATTKAEWSDAGSFWCAYLTPGGGYWTSNPCSV